MITKKHISPEELNAPPEIVRIEMPMKQYEEDKLKKFLFFWNVAKKRAKEQDWQVKKMIGVIKQNVCPIIGILEEKAESKSSIQR